jgi:hypothetical protein
VDVEKQERNLNTKGTKGTKGTKKKEIGAYWSIELCLQDIYNLCMIDVGFCFLLRALRALRVFDSCFLAFEHPPTHRLA